MLLEWQNLEPTKLKINFITAFNCIILEDVCMSIIGNYSFSCNYFGISIESFLF